MMWKQFLAVTWINLGSLRYRLGSSQMNVLGVAGVVGVLVTLLMLSNSLEHTLNGVQNPGRVVLVRSGATSEINGAISPEQAQTVRFLPFIRKQNGAPMLTNESYASINLEAVSGTYRSTPLRGITSDSFIVRQEVRLLEGRKPSPGAAEILIGKSLATELPMLSLGSELKIKRLNFTVVGIFEAGGSFFESELWTSVEVVNDLFKRRGQYSSLTLQLDDPGESASFKQLIDNDPRLILAAKSESEFYGSQAELTRQLIATLTWLLGIIMSIGAVFSVLNTTYAATASRVKEIATLRALGFGRFAVVSSVVLEGLLLASIGAGLATLALTLAVDGQTISTMGSNTLLSVELELDARSIAFGVVLAMSLGVVGSLVPAIKSARQPIVAGLRQP